MLGASAEIVVADALLRDVPDVAADVAWPILRAAAMDPTAPPGGRGGREHVEPYMQYGYVPSSVGRSASVTTEYAHDDFALADLAATLGADADAALLDEHRLGWRELYDPAVGFIRARNEDGTFPSGSFDPLELSINAVYLFAQAGRPDLTARWVRWIIDNLYADTPEGLAGNDDGGTLGAWYVFSALGLYPIPGSDRYVLGAPLFPQARVLVGGRELVILAEGVSDRNPLRPGGDPRRCAGRPGDHARRAGRRVRAALRDGRIAARRVTCSTGGAFDADPALDGTDLVVEQAQEGQPDQPFDPPSLGQVMGVHAKVGLLMTEARETRDPDQVPLLATDRRTDHGDRFALARAVAKLVENLGNDDRLCRPCVEHEVDMPESVPARTPDAATDDDQVAPGIEARGFHGTVNPSDLPRTDPVQKLPISEYRVKASLI